MANKKNGSSQCKSKLELLENNLNVSISGVEKEFLKGKIDESEQFSRIRELYRWFQEKLLDTGKDLRIVNPII